MLGISFGQLPLGQLKTASRWQLSSAVGPKNGALLPVKRSYLPGVVMKGFCETWCFRFSYSGGGIKKV